MAAAQAKFDSIKPMATVLAQWETAPLGQGTKLMLDGPPEETRENETERRPSARPQALFGRAQKAPPTLSIGSCDSTGLLGVRKCERPSFSTPR